MRFVCLPTRGPARTRAAERAARRPGNRRARRREQGPTPPPAQTTYVVQQGDTLAAIAQQFGTTVEALQAANGIEDPNEIIIGQVLVIP